MIITSVQIQLGRPQVFIRDLCLSEIYVPFHSFFFFCTSELLSCLTKQFFFTSKRFNLVFFSKLYVFYFATVSHFLSHAWHSLQISVTQSSDQNRPHTYLGQSQRCSDKESLAVCEALLILTCSSCFLLYPTRLSIRSVSKMDLLYFELNGYCLGEASCTKTVWVYITEPC